MVLLRLWTVVYELWLLFIGCVTTIAKQLDGKVLDPTITRYWLNTFGCRAFSVAGPPTVWNSLPDSLHDPNFYHLQQQQQLHTIAEDEFISSSPLGTHSAVEMLHDSALYKPINDIVIDMILLVSPGDNLNRDQIVECL